MPELFASYCASHRRIWPRPLSPQRGPARRTPRTRPSPSPALARRPRPPRLRRRRSPGQRRLRRWPRRAPHSRRLPPPRRCLYRRRPLRSARRSTITRVSVCSDSSPRGAPASRSCPPPVRTWRPRLYRRGAMRRGAPNSCWAPPKAMSSAVIFGAAMDVRDLPLSTAKRNQPPCQSRFLRNVESHNQSPDNCRDHRCGQERDDCSLSIRCLGNH